MPIERFDELNALYDMDKIEGFRETRYKNLVCRREICVIAEQDGVIVGEISVMTENANIPVAVIPNHRLYLFGLRVKPDFRRQGIATALVRYVVALCVSRGIFEFTIGVEHDNIPAQNLYEQMGFRILLKDCSEKQGDEVCRYDLLLLNIARL